MVTQKTIKITAYKNPQDEPTCRISDLEQCLLLGTRRFGTIEVCMFGENQDLMRDNSGVGYLIPKESCPIWGCCAKQ